MDVGVVSVLFADGVACDVEELISEVVRVPDAMVVVSAVPDLSSSLFHQGKLEIH